MKRMDASMLKAGYRWIYSERPSVYGKSGYRYKKAALWQPWEMTGGSFLFPPVTGLLCRRQTVALVDTNDTCVRDGATMGANFDVSPCRLVIGAGFYRLAHIYLLSSTGVITNSNRHPNPMNKKEYLFYN